MKTNEALEPDEVEEGWVLTCQSVSTEGPVVIEYKNRSDGPAAFGVETAFS